MRNTLDRYGIVAVALHWLIAVLIVINLGLGIALSHLAITDRALMTWIPIHKSIGLSVLVLSVLRLLWRLGNPVPRMPGALPRMQKWVAGASHWAFYALMIALPMTGWAESTVGGHLAVYFGLFTWPALGPLRFVRAADRKTLTAEFLYTHAYLAYILLALLVFHVAAALHHHLVRRDGVLRRMLPQRAGGPVRIEDSRIDE